MNNRFSSLGGEETIPLLFSALICTYNGSRTIQKTLQALEQLRRQGGVLLEVVVVDNASSDSTAAIVRAYADRARIPVHVVCEPIPGRCYALQTGLACCSGEWVINVDDDTYLDVAYLDSVCRLTRDPRVGILGGDSSLPPETAVEKELTCFLNYLAIGKQCPSEAETARVNAVWGAGMVVRRDLQVAYLACPSRKKTGRSGASLASGEDTETCLFARLRGYQVVASSQMRLTHDIHPDRLTKEYLRRLVPTILRDRASLSSYDLVLDGRSPRALYAEVLAEARALIRCKWWRIRSPQDWRADLAVESSKARLLGLVEALYTIRRDIQRLNAHRLRSEASTCM